MTHEEIQMRAQYRSGCNVEITFEYHYATAVERSNADVQTRP
jgi:hypothetical protein